MANRQGFTMKGAKELQKALRQLGPEVATKAGASGTRKAANYLRDELRQAAPEGDKPSVKVWRNKDGSRQSNDYGRLKDNILTRKAKALKAHTVRFVVTTRSAFWGRFSEFGTSHEPARPWFRPTLDQVAGKVIDAISTELKSAIERAARKARK